MPVCSERIQKYFDGIAASTNAAYSVASEARSRGFDPEPRVEIFLASDVAARVEGLVGPRGVAERIRELLREKKREEVVFEIAREIVEGKFADANGAEGAGAEKTQEQLVEQAIRTGLALYTEGVVSAPIEGISKARVRRNPDGSKYLAVFFAGPIRGAGGTGQAMTLVLGDFCRRLAGIENYRPTGDETDRFVEEVNLYSMRTRAGQYTPTEEEVRHVVANCPVCIDGEPTEDYEIAVKRNLPAVETNRVRGGVCLVMGEGVCLKAAKILQITKRARK
jgi:DNA polymerase II large subunit